MSTLQSILEENNIQEHPKAWIEPQPFDDVKAAFVYTDTSAIFDSEEGIIEKERYQILYPTLKKFYSKSSNALKTYLVNLNYPNVRTDFKNAGVFLSHSVSTDSTNKIELTKKILSFKSLENNWDGYGAIPTEIDSAANALIFIDLIGADNAISADNIFPNPNGTVSFQWENEHQVTISIEIGNSYLNGYFHPDKNAYICLEKVELSNNRDIEYIKENIQNISKI